MKNSRLAPTRASILAAASALAFLAGNTAHAQQADAAAGKGQTENAASEPAAQSAEIIVTAQFRSQSAQNTPVTLIARGADFLEQRNIVSVKDLAVNIPGFQSGGLALSIPQYSIRGTRSSTLDVASEDSIAVYIDGVYIARPGGTTLDLFDLERVEVLKGPQGTLYGRNAVGGVINYISRTPDDTLRAQLVAELGNYEAVNFRGSANVPLIAGKLFANIAFSSRDRKGFVDNLLTGHDLGTENSQAVRAALKWVASDNVDFVLRGDYNRSRSIGPGYSSVALTTARTDVDPVTGAPVLSQVTWWDPRSTDPRLNPTGKVITDIHQSLQDLDGLENRDVYGLSLTGNADLGFAKLTSISAWRHLYNDQVSDFDGTPCLATSTNFLASASVKAFAPGNPDLLGPPRCITLADQTAVPFLLNRTVAQAFGLDSNGSQNLQRTDHADQYSQELRLLSQPGGFLTFGDRMNWVLGGTAFFEKARRNQFDTLFGLHNARSYFSQNRTTSFGIYSQATVKLTEALHLTGGLRFSYDRKRFEFALSNRAVTGVLASSGGRPVLVSPLDVSSTINFSNLPGVFGFPVGFPNPALTNGAGICDVGTRCVPLTQASKSWTSLDPKIGLEYRPSKSLMVYGSYTQAYKSGGFASTPEDLVTGSTPYQPETIKAWELGVKTSWFNRRLLVNLALYKNDSKNVQIQAGYDHDNNPGTRPFVGVRNAAGLQVKGVEVEVTAKPTDSLSLFANYAYTHARFRDFLVFGGGVVVDDNSGKRPIGTPDHAIGAGFDFKTAVGSSLLAHFAADWNYKSKIYFTETNYEEARQDAYSIFNAAITVGPNDNKWQLRLWAKNLLNKDYVTHIASSGASRVRLLNTPINAGVYTIVPGAPRTIGIAATINY